MQLLNPAAFAFAFIIPLIIVFYLLKPRYQEITVSSTYLWEQVLKEIEVSTPWQRLRKNLLLLMQLLAALLLLIALSRPLWAGAGSMGQELFVVLDCSASMMANDVQPSRLAEAQRQVGKLIDEMAARDQMTLITMGDTPQILLAASHDKLRLRQALNEAQANNGSAALEPALSLLASLSENSKSGLALIFSDGGTLPLQNELSLNCPLELRQLGKASGNLAISTLATRSQGGKVYTLARVQNYGDQDVQSDIELWADGKLFDARSLNLKARAGQEVIWSQLPPDTQTVAAFLANEQEHPKYPEGEVRLDYPDYLSNDNQSFAVVDKIVEQRVLLVSPGNIFLEKALQTKPGLKLFKTSGSSYGQEMTNYDLYIFDSYLPERLPQGNTIIINPPPQNSFINVKGDLKNIAQLAAARDDALLKYVEVDGWQIAGSRLIETPFWGRSLLTYEGFPILLLGENPYRTAVFSFDFHASNIPLQTGFPILVQNLLAWLLPPAAGFSFDAENAALIIKARPEAQKIILQRPGRKEESYTAPFPKSLAVEANGLYSITQIIGDKSYVTYLAKNLSNTLESDISPAELPLNGLLKTARLNTELTRQKEIWNLFTWMVLLLLLLEWEVYRRGY